MTNWINETQARPAASQEPGPAICLSPISRLLLRVSGRDAHQLPTLRGQGPGTLMLPGARFG